MVLSRYLWVILLGGCAVARSAAPPQLVGPRAEAPWGDEPAASATDGRQDHASEAAVLPEFLRDFLPALTPSLLGSLAAAVPGQASYDGRASFGRVHVAAKIAGGFAYTEVEEELVNEGSREAEILATFRAPLGGLIARLALGVDERWIEAAVVERKRAADVYRGIVERRRDPALLEQDPSGTVKLRVFPVPPHGARRVLIGYAQPLARREDRYRFELGLRLPEAVPPIAELSADVELSDVEASQIALGPGSPNARLETATSGTRVRWEGAQVRPADFRVSFAATRELVTTFAPLKARGSERFVALRLIPDLPARPAERAPMVWLIDTSVGQRDAALDVSKAMASQLVEQLSPGERFAILACDTACIAFPRLGLATASSESQSEARRFIASLEARGASDIGYALFEAMLRTQGRARSQIVYFGDARPTAGDLRADQMLERLSGRGELSDLRLVGVGSALDADALGELSASLEAAETTVSADPEDVELVARWLEQPVLRDPSLLLPSGFELAYPRQLPNLVGGDELLVLARLGRASSGVHPAQLSGKFDDGSSLQPWRSQLRLEPPSALLQADTAPRLWAHARLRALEQDDAPAAYADIVELSERYQVLSPHTSWLALDSAAMFRAFDIEQQRGFADFSSTPLTARSAPRAAPLASREHRTRPPALRLQASTFVSGRLPPEPIQDAVRRNAGRFRACYHQGLLRHPHLAGTVTTRFVIGRDGSVAAATDSGSTLTDRAVVACIVRAFRTLVFPPPEAPVTIVYPFALSPSAAQAAPSLPTPWSSREAVPHARLAPAQSGSETRASVPRLAAAELAEQVERDPRDVELQLAAARAYEAEHSERRACAHFRAAAALGERDLHAQYQALRCRARVMHERVSVLADVARLELHSPAIDALVAHIRALDEIPAFSPEPAAGD